MDTINTIFTKRPLNPGSLLIRCANPVSFIKIAPASHVVILDGNTGFAMEASATHGVRRAPVAEIMSGLTVVCKKSFQVPDAELGLAWGRATCERKAKYDWRGALALGLAPDRKWQDDDDWFCFEFEANIMAKAGRIAFADNAHVTAYMLMSLKNEM